MGRVFTISVANLDTLYTISYHPLGKWIGQFYDDQESAVHAAIIRAFALS